MCERERGREGERLCVYKSAVNKHISKRIIITTTIIIIIIIIIIILFLLSQLSMSRLVLFHNLNRHCVCVCVYVCVCVCDVYVCWLDRGECKEEIGIFFVEN